MGHTKWVADQQNHIEIQRMIVFSTLRYGEEAYGSASQPILKKLEPTQHTQQMVEVSLWTIRNRSNSIRILCEVFLP
jgi:hypothetical protein